MIYNILYVIYMTFNLCHMIYYVWYVMLCFVTLCFIIFYHIVLYYIVYCALYDRIQHNMIRWIVYMYTHLWYDIVILRKINMMKGQFSNVLEFYQIILTWEFVLHLCTTSSWYIHATLHATRYIDIHTHIETTIHTTIEL